MILYIEFPVIFYMYAKFLVTGTPRISFTFFPDAPKSLNNVTGENLLFRYFSIMRISVYTDKNICRIVKKNLNSKAKKRREINYFFIIKTKITQISQFFCSKFYICEQILQTMVTF